MSLNSSALASSEAASTSSAGISLPVSAAVAATCTEVGNTSLEDCDAFTWSLGCTVVEEPASARWRLASSAMTSLVFMFELVPEPVWNTSMGKCPSYSPLATASAAAMIASARSPSMTPNSRLARAAAFFTCARALMCSDSRRLPEIGKFSTARWVWARYSASFGTRTSPMVSCSMRKSSLLVMA